MRLAQDLLEGSEVCLFVKEPQAPRGPVEDRIFVRSSQRLSARSGMSTRYNRPSPLVRIAIALAALIVLSEMGAAAPAQTADRQCWEYGNGSIRRSLTWVEQSRKTSHTFVEVARNPIFVELLDPVRHYTVRLYPHKVLLRGGKGGVKRLPKFARVSEGSWTDPDTRLDWQSPAGTFRAQNKEPGGTGASSEAAVWVERNFDGMQCVPRNRPHE